MSMSMRSAGGALSWGVQHCSQDSTYSGRPSHARWQVLTNALGTGFWMTILALFMRNYAQTGAVQALGTDPKLVNALLEWPTGLSGAVDYAVLAGTVALVTGARLQLLQVWGDFRAATYRSNKQVRARDVPRMLKQCCSACSRCMHACMHGVRAAGRVGSACASACRRRRQTDSTRTAARVCACAYGYAAACGAPAPFPPPTHPTRTRAQVLGPLGWLDIALVALASGVPEELLFRGAIIPASFPDWRGVLVSGVIFGVLHNSGGRNAAFAAWAGAVGCAYGGAFLLTHNIWVPAAAHVISNFASAAVWKVEDGQGKT